MTQHPRPWWRGAAALAAGLILFLLVASACPAVHERCCGHAHANVVTDAGCVVFGFANGVVSVTGMTLAPAPMVFVVATLEAGSEAAPLARTAWRTPPACGPPAAV